MNVSVFDLFKLGVGPSSSHTMGPMTAAGRFLERLGVDTERAARVETTLYASLALTGRGHATDRAVILGLAGLEPRSLDPDAADALLGEIRASGRLKLGGAHEIAFDEARDLLWEGRTRLPPHPIPPGPRQPAQQLVPHLHVRAVEKQHARHHVIRHQPSRQQPMPLLPRIPLLDRQIHRLRRERRRQHPDPHQIRQPNPRPRLDLTSPRHEQRCRS